MFFLTAETARFTCIQIFLKIYIFIKNLLSEDFLKLFLPVNMCRHEN